MSKEKINIKNSVMDKIQSGSVMMRPKVYFIAGSFLVFVGLAASFVVSIFLITITRFSLRTHGPMGQHRLNELLTSFPWWAPVLAILGMVIGMILLRKYDFSYKRNYLLIIAGFVLAILLSGWAIDSLGLDNVWFRQGPMRGIMRQYMQNGRPVGPGRMMRQY